MLKGIKSDRIEIQEINQSKRPALCLNLGKTDYKRALDLQYDLVNAKKNKLIEYDESDDMVLIGNRQTGQIEESEKEELTLTEKLIARSFA